ncbi:MAG TPA: FCD domain-containing protein [bacterium]|nr:FCD domain-containing protein [bacterium]
MPTERELADALGVNRTSLRERLAALESLGLIRRTQGSGTYLSMPDPAFVQLYFEMALKLHYFTLEQLEQARELLERELAYAAAQHATPEDAAALSRAAARLGAAETAEEGAVADYDFHLALARASHNPVLLLIIEGLASVLLPVLQYRNRVAHMSPEADARLTAVHFPILEAVRAHDPAAAAGAVDAHFRAWNEEYARAFPEAPDEFQSTSD